MVKHGTAKKRRRGLVVTRKAPKHKAVKVANSVPAEVKHAYDKDKSPEENLHAFGLDPNPNNFKKKSIPGGRGSKKDAAFMGFIPLPESDNFVEKNPKRRQMSEHDQEYVVKCIRKHGENYKAMERDIITNDQQYTEDKMKKLCARYLALGNRDKLVKL